MTPLLFATTNQHKFEMAQQICTKANISIEQVVIDIDEIQGEDPDLIVRDKAKRAYESTGKPVVVSDDSWAIHGLNGFPGAYMKSMNHWLRAQDFINLTHDLTDRRVTLYQHLAYQDELETVIFTSEIHGTLAKTPRGNTQPAFLQVAMLDIDNGHTLAEIYDAGKQHEKQRVSTQPDAWHEMAAWYAAKNS